MTGSLTILASETQRFRHQSTIADLTLADNGLTTGYSPSFGVFDKNSVYAGWVQSLIKTDGNVQLFIGARNKGTGSEISNTLSLNVNNDGTKTVGLSDASAWRSAIGNGNANAFIRADGTLTRALEGNVAWQTKYTTFDMKSSTNGLSSDIWPGALQLIDTNGLTANYYGGTIGSDGAVGAGIHAYNYNSSGTQVGHSSLTIYVKKDGTTQYGVTDAPAFRKAIGTTIVRTYQISSNLTVAQNTATKFLEISLSPGLNLLCWSWYVSGSTIAQNINWLWSTSTTATTTPTLGTGIQVPVGYMNAGQYHTEITTFWSNNTQKVYLYGSHAGTGNLSMRAAVYNFNIPFGTQA